MEQLLLFLVGLQLLAINTPSILFSALFLLTIMRGMPPVRILTGQPSLANNPFVANTGPIPLILPSRNLSREESL